MSQRSAEMATSIGLGSRPSILGEADPRPGLEPPPRWRARLRTLVFVTLAWLPFLIVWALLNAISFEIPMTTAFFAAVSAIGSAAVLGFGVWWISGRLALPERLGVGFYLRHLALATVYSALWIGWGAALTSMRGGLSFAEAVADSPMIGWRFVTGVWLYGMLAGASYAIRMRRRLQRQRELALRAEAVASQARLAHVRSQLRPHFLFNALHSVSSLMAIDVDEAQAALERLGGMLRYALDDDAELVPLRREWSFTRDYLAIESLRLEGGLRVEASCDPEAKEISVPPFCLQALVENAVRHGIAGSLLDGASDTLRIEAKLDGSELELNVADDGPGADLAAIEASRGRGLRLLREGLAAHWGGAARLELDSAPGAGFRASVRLPADTAAPTSPWREDTRCDAW